MITKLATIFSINRNKCPLKLPSESCTRKPRKNFKVGGREETLLSLNPENKKKIKIFFK